MMLYTAVIVLGVLLVVTEVSCSNNRDLPQSFNGTTSRSFNNTGIQILFTSFNNFTAQGSINEWRARLSGSTTSSDIKNIDFQIFQPIINGSSSDTYELVYGNSYHVNVSSTNATLITEQVGIQTSTTFIPIRPGYIVGVYLPGSVVDELSLLYDEDGGDDEVYYWENIDNRTCEFSLCTGKVLKGINLQIGWKFVASSVTGSETIVDQLRAQDLSYCHSSSLVSACNNMSSPDIPSISTDHDISVSMVVPSTVGGSSSLLGGISSSLNSTSSLPASSTTMISSNTQSTGVPPTSSDPSPLFGPELIAAFSVVLVLLFIVLILIIAIGICCCMRRKPIIESSTTHGFDNPDYNGVVSTGSVKQKPIELTSVSQDSTKPIITTTVTTGSPVPQFDDSHYYSTAGMQNTHQESPKTTPLSPPPINNTHKPRSASSSSSFIPHPSVLSTSSPGHSSENRYDRSPSDSKSHYYSSPTTDVSNLSFPMSSSGIYDTVNNEDKPSPSVPAPTQDPEYDEAIVCTSASTTAQNQTLSADKSSSKDSNAIYAYVPTSEQRKLLDWRYELPLDSEYNKLNFFEEQNKFWAPASTTSGLYEQLATNKYREIPKENIRITNELGQGQFGSVSKGIWTSPDGRHEVAIKMLKSNATEDDRLKLLQEAAIMGQFCNKNVVKVQGVVTLGDPIMLVLEFMPRGDLISYLRTIAPKHGRWHPPPNLPKLLLRFCRDIASGMRYLSGKSFVHRDLAARNILLSRDLTSKIGDFGMARDLMQDDGNYYTSSGGIIPIKWTAPEALNFRKYSTDSDVWSYGMVLFEIWSLGRKPFSELSNPIVIALINSKHCQAPPPGCPRPMYQLMVDCWHPEHSERPPFTKIVKHLESSSDTLLRWNKENNIRGKNAHILGAPLDEASDLYVDLQRVYQQSMLLGANGSRQRSKSNY